MSGLRIDLPSFQTLCSKCFDARDAELRQSSKQTIPLGLGVFASLLMFCAVFLYGLHESLHYHMTFTERVMKIFLWTLVALYGVVRVWAAAHGGRQFGATVHDVVLSCRNIASLTPGGTPPPRPSPVVGVIARRRPSLRADRLRSYRAAPLSGFKINSWGRRMGVG